MHTVACATLVVLGSLATLSPSAPLADDLIRLKPIPRGAAQKLGYNYPQSVQVSEKKPASVAQEPKNLSAPLYGTLPVGKGIVFVLDEPEGKTPVLYVDANANGNLADDSKAEWRLRETKEGGTTSAVYEGAVMVNIAPGGKPAMMAVRIMRYGKKDARYNAAQVQFYRDYACEGMANIGGKSYKVALSDENASGDFRGRRPAIATNARTNQSNASGVTLLIDLNGNGKFDATGESFDTARTFSVDGREWRVSDMAWDGGSFRVVPAEKQSAPAAKPAPSDLSEGSQFPPFEAVDMSGNTVHFPGDYKGKIVLLDFWATWCGPCMKEMPNVVAAYSRYKRNGFEVLGVSLDVEQTVKEMPKVMAKANITWPQILNGGAGQPDLAEMYKVDGIPMCFLVNGTTGAIVGKGLRGAALAPAIERALSSR